MNDLGKGVVWITGASTGIGHALTCHYLEAGYTVCASSRSISQDHFRAVNTYGRLHLFKLDVCQKEQNKAVVETILSEFGQLDIAILNAGNNRYVSVNNFSSEPFEDLFQINVLSVVYALEALLPHLREKTAHISVMSSVVSYTGLPLASAYGASKAALRNMVQALQVELENDPLHLSLICPGFVKTPLTDKNTFNMPFIISAAEAAKEIFKGISKKQYEIHFPKRMSLILKFISSLPQKIMIRRLAKSIKT